MYDPSLPSELVTCVCVCSGANNSFCTCVPICGCSVGDREAALSAALRLLQQFYLDLKEFLNWLTEAETTCNVLLDASHKERLLEDPEAVRHLLGQFQVLTLSSYCRVSLLLGQFQVLTLSSYCRVSHLLGLFQLHTRR